MLEIAPKHIFSNSYHFRTDEHAPVVLNASAWRERAEFELHGSRYRLRRASRLKGPFLLERDGRVIAHAHKPSAFRDRFELEVNGRKYVLRRPAMFSRRFVVFDGEQQIGEIAPAGAFSRRARVQLPSDWTVPAQVFAFWLVLLTWNRQAAAASGS